MLHMHFINLSIAAGLWLGLFRRQTERIQIIYIYDSANHCFLMTAAVFNERNPTKIKSYLRRTQEFEWLMCRVKSFLPKCFRNWCDRGVLYDQYENCSDLRILFVTSNVQTFSTSIPDICRLMTSKRIKICYCQYPVGPTMLRLASISMRSISSFQIQQTTTKFFDSVLSRLTTFRYSVFL